MQNKKIKKAEKSHYIVAGLPRPYPFDIISKDVLGLIIKWLNSRCDKVSLKQTATGFASFFHSQEGFALLPDGVFWDENPTPIKLKMPSCFSNTQDFSVAEGMKFSVIPNSDKLLCADQTSWAFLISLKGKEPVTIIDDSHEFSKIQLVGNTMLAKSNGLNVRLWSLETGKQILDMKLEESTSFNQALCFTPKNAFYLNQQKRLCYQSYNMNSKVHVTAHQNDNFHRLQALNTGGTIIMELDNNNGCLLHYFTPDSPNQLTQIFEKPCWSDLTVTDWDAVYSIDINHTLLKWEVSGKTTTYQKIETPTSEIKTIDKNHLLFISRNPLDRSKGNYAIYSLREARFFCQKPLGYSDRSENINNDCDVIATASGLVIEKTKTHSIKQLQMQNSMDEVNKSDQPRI